MIRRPTSLLALASICAFSLALFAQDDKDKKDDAPKDKPKQEAPQSIFPDKNLEKVVRKYVFEKRNNEEPLLEKDVENISTISGKGAGVKDLSGLEKCRSLADLDLEDNEVSDLAPLKDLDRLQKLNLAKNKIKDIQPIAGLTGLQYLELSGNEIADLKPLAKLENMRSLYLADNKIKDIKPLAELTKIWSLYLEGNQVSNLKPLASLKSLDSLNASGNGISDLSALAELTEWKYLILNDNKIGDLDVLVKMADKDAQGDQRFAPFWRIYLTGNPLSDEAKSKQVAAIKKHGGRVTVE